MLKGSHWLKTDSTHFFFIPKYFTKTNLSHWYEKLYIQTNKNWNFKFDNKFVDGLFWNHVIVRLLCSLHWLSWWLKAKHQVSTDVSCCCFNLKREVGILASSIIDLKQKQLSDDIWFLVTGKSNEKNIEYEIWDFHWSTVLQDLYYPSFTSFPREYLAAYDYNTRR